MSIDDLASDLELDENEAYTDSEMMALLIDDENVDYLADLCNDDVLDSYTRKYLMSYNDKTKSKTVEEYYLKNVIANKTALAEMAERQIRYEQQWKEQKTAADMF